jgi:hypothetical protein
LLSYSTAEARAKVKILTLSRQRPAGQGWDHLIS